MASQGPRIRLCCLAVSMVLFVGACASSPPPSDSIPDVRGIWVGQFAASSGILAEGGGHGELRIEMTQEGNGISATAEHPGFRGTFTGLLRGNELSGTGSGESRALGGGSIYVVGVVKGDEMELLLDRNPVTLRRVRSLRADAPPPAPVITIDISYPSEGARLPEELVTVVGLISSAERLRSLDLMVNERLAPVSRDVRVQPGAPESHPFNAQVPLRVGENVIAVIAVDIQGRTARVVRTVHREVAVAQRAPAPSAARTAGERWLVVVGIDRYQDPAIPSLRYATADAEAVFKLLIATGGVKPANARLLLNQAATQRNLRQVLGDFLRQKALRDDEVVIYYAGHGATEPDASAEGGVAKYLVPWDADPASLFSTAIPMEEIDRVFGRLAARKILMIQDTCFSGGAGGRTFLAKGFTVRNLTLTDRFLQELAQKEGRMILTASDVNQLSVEDPALGHGVFTHYLLEAVGGPADLDGDGAITVRETHLYLQRKVHEHSRGVQTPQLYNIGDMVLTRRKPAR